MEKKIEKCNRKKTFMTPCFLEDGEICLSDDSCCVGCGIAMEFLMNESEQEKLWNEVIPMVWEMFDGQGERTIREHIKSKFRLTRKT